MLTPDASTDVPTSESVRYVPRHSAQGRATESGLSVVSWSHWGFRRLYAYTAEGDQVGWVDLDTWNRVLTMPELEATFEAALRETAGGSEESSYAPRRGLADAADFRATELTVDEPADEPWCADPGFTGRRAFFGEAGEPNAGADRITARRAF